MSYNLATHWPVRPKSVWWHLGGLPAWRPAIAADVRLTAGMEPADPGRDESGRVAGSRNRGGRRTRAKGSAEEPFESEGDSSPSRVGTRHVRNHRPTRPSHQSARLLGSSPDTAPTAALQRVIEGRPRHAEAAAHRGLAGAAVEGGGDLIDLLGIEGRRPTAPRPRRRAAASPAFTRSRISARSYWARAPKMENSSSPCGVVVSMCSVSERKPTPRPSGR